MNGFDGIIEAPYVSRKPADTFVLPITLSPITGVFEVAQTLSDLEYSAVTFEISMVPNAIRVQLTKNRLGGLVTVDIPLNSGLDVMEKIKPVLDNSERDIPRLSTEKPCCKNEQRNKNGVCDNCGSCCKNEQRNMNGGCDNCGDPCF